MWDFSALFSEVADWFVVVYGLFDTTSFWGSLLVLGFVVFVILTVLEDWRGVFDRED